MTLKWRLMSLTSDVRQLTSKKFDWRQLMSIDVIWRQLTLDIPDTRSFLKENDVAWRWKIDVFWHLKTLSDEIWRYLTLNDDYEYCLIVIFTHFSSKPSKVFLEKFKILIKINVLNLKKKILDNFRRWMIKYGYLANFVVVIQRHST